MSYTTCQIDGKRGNAMIDSGSSDTFIDEAMTKKRNLVIFPKERTIPLAD